MAVRTSRVSHAFFPGFDVFRGIGILFVVLAHTPTQSAVAAALRPLGALGVHMFFALSGFLITHRLVEEQAQSGGISLASFYRRRAGRILPPAVIYLAVLALLGPALNFLQSSGKEIAAALFFYRNVYQPPIPAAWYTSHFWSLSLEEQFYLVWPWILFAFSAHRLRASAAALAMIGATAIWRVHVLGADPGADLYRPDLLADHLLWGCVIGLNWKQVKRIPAPLWTGFAGMLASAALIYTQPKYWQPFFAISVAFGFILAADAVEGWASKRIVFRKLGEASYDIYIWQSLFLPLPLAGLALPLAQRIPWGYFFIAATAGGSFLLTFPKRRRKA